MLTDDLANNLVPYMRHRQGTSFDRYVVTDSLCCPSRASIFTGRYPHSTGVVTNTPPEAQLAAKLARMRACSGGASCHEADAGP